MLKQGFLQYLKNHWRDHHPFYHYKKSALDFLLNRNIQPTRKNIKQFSGVAISFTSRLLKAKKIKKYAQTVYLIIDEKKRW
ncbi:MAG: hypothetical protein K9W44_16355 [Candidatus Lokiarchaeota archaeon]|nr:hypothetical protein [Candidatus Harpocratesius repetitus]